MHHDLYISDSNKVVNHYLRTGEIIDGDWVTYDLNKIEAIMSDADKAFSMSSLPKDSILYRYVEDLDYLPEIGEIYTEPAYVATSMSSGLSKDFGNKRMEILAPSGTACIAAGNKFAEILLNKNCSFKVLYRDFDSAILLLLQ